MNYYLQTALVISMQLLPVVTGFWRRKWLDAGGRVMLIVSVMGLVTELVATYAAFRFHNNLPVYNIASILLAFGVIWYFGYCIDYLRRSGMEIFLMVVTFVVWLITLYWNKGQASLNVLFQDYEGTLTIILSLLLIEKHIHMRQLNQLSANPHFWFALLLLLTWSVTLVTWNLYDTLAKAYPGAMPFVETGLTIISVLCNAGFAAVFAGYPKLQYAVKR